MHELVSERVGSVSFLMAPPNILKTASRGPLVAEERMRSDITGPGVDRNANDLIRHLGYVTEIQQGLSEPARMKRNFATFLISSISSSSIADGEIAELVANFPTHVETERRNGARPTPGGASRHLPPRRVTISGLPCCCARPTAVLPALSFSAALAPCAISSLTISLRPKSAAIIRRSAPHRCPR